ncbi:MAG TPA: hypothetical protein EYH44_05810 [Thermoprotei archaeon]|nr:hypothetical protein [Thermoprotei archaeon]
MERKIKRAAYLLLVRRHSYPGAREWELEKYLGRNYEEVLKRLGEILIKIGLEIKVVNIPEGDRILKHYLVVPERSVKESIGGSIFRSDEAAVLAIAVSTIISSENMRAPKGEIIELAKTKLPQYRVEKALNRFIRLKYLVEDGDYIKLGPRSFLELDIDMLISQFTSSLKGVEAVSHGGDREES